MLTISEFISKWNTLRADHGQAAYQRIDASHPLDFYFGYDSARNRELILLSEKEIKQLVESKSIVVEIGKRNDGRWSVCFRLVKGDQEDVFMNLCYDLIETSRNKNDKIKGVAFVIERFLKWQRLLQQGNDGLLTDTAVKGLIGELILLEELLVKRSNILQTVEGWRGPNKSDRDFIYNNIWYEVKTTDPSSNSVKISSVEQLDSNDEGNLVVMYIEKTSACERNSFTLNGIVSRIKDKLETDISAVVLFEDKLLDLGYSYRKEYNETHYIFRRKREFKVDNNFPRLRRDMLANGIINVSYNLSISSLNEWECV
ncbi:MAG: hypothetical protein K0R69_2076 [Clostridia bacterium]|jgi:hypothetical protein|nr:hypothetical protein [Clostridia bacterium]